MCQKRQRFLLILFGLVLILASLLAAPQIVAHADGPCPAAEQGSCIQCHEDLYLLHDTGKWYCLKEAPMNCVGCHGGDSTALTKEAAHANRQAYPIINENSSKCRECHPAQSVARERFFRLSAGVPVVMVEAAYIPAASVPEAPILPAESQKKSFLEYLPLGIGLLMAAVLTIALIRRLHRGKETPE